MSLVDPARRVQEIQAQIARLQQAAPVVGDGAFARQLQTVAGASAPPASAAPAAAGGPSAPAGVAAGDGRYPFAAPLDTAAQRNGVEPALLAGLVRQESGFDPNARSSAGAQGLGQLMPGTASALGVSDPFDPAQALNGAARYLRQQLDRFGGDPVKALAAYNAGPGAVARYGGVPPYAETRHYVRQVLAYAEQYRRGGSSAPTAGSR